MSTTVIICHKSPLFINLQQNKDYIILSIKELFVFQTHINIFYTY